MKNVTIEFDKENSDQRTDSGWNWFCGKVKTEGKEFDFSLLEMNTNVGGQNTTAIETMWMDDAPQNAKEIESLIEEKFEEEFS